MKTYFLTLRHKKIITINEELKIIIEDQIKNKSSYIVAGDFIFRKNSIISIVPTVDIFST